jgi:glycosyltransferase involved in cell wall biosynthesis
MSEPVDLTVALCTRNRAPLLPAALRGLGRQRAPLAWELLVVDNASADDTGARAHAAAHDFPVPLHVVHEERVGLSFARNRALAEARGEILLFIDDDAVARPGWLAAHARAYADARLVGTGGRIAPVLPAAAPEWFRTHVMTRIGGPSSRYDFGEESLGVGPGTPRPPPFGANLGLRRSVALAVGGFRTDLGWGNPGLPGEETELAARAAAEGGHLLYLPDAIVDHHLDPARCTHRYFVHWHVRLGRSEVRIDPPRTAARRRRRAMKTARRLTAASLRSMLRGNATHIVELRARRSVLAGRLIELLRPQPQVRPVFETSGQKLRPLKQAAADAAERPRASSSAGSVR